MDEFYIQQEVQVNDKGTKSVIPLIYDDLNEALAKHYTVLAAAAKSTLPYHGSFILRNDGIVIEGRYFTHVVEED